MIFDPITFLFDTNINQNNNKKLKYYPFSINLSILVINSIQFNLNREGFCGLGALGF